MTNPKVSVIVACYRPELRKMLLTLQSILMQKECSYEIIVSDDGSKENFFSEAKAFFAKHRFEEYKLITSEKNHGTVMNIWQGLQECQGDYIRLISPGDFLHGFYALRDWVNFMDDRPEVTMTFCDPVYYHFEGGEIVPISEFAHPQHTSAYTGGDCLRPYLLCNDICLGAATMCRTKALKRYLSLLLHKVIYAEDNVYRIMTYAGERFQFYPANSVLYEYGTGISTNGQSAWSVKIQKDWQEANAIMLSMPASHNAVKYRIPSLLSSDNRHKWQARLNKWSVYPMSFIFALKQRISPRYTPLSLDKDFVHQLLAE